MGVTLSAMDTPAYVIVSDRQTVPDAGALARMAGTPDIEAAEAEEQMGQPFQKPPLHSIVCTGALVRCGPSPPRG